MIANQAQGLALLCDLQGVILQVLRNDLGLEKATPGNLFFGLVEKASRTKALNFLTDLKSRSAALDWEMNITVNTSIITLHFAGGLMGDSLLITAGVNGQLAERLYEDMLRINNEQTNLLRSVLKDKLELETNRAASDPMYNEISRLNNELVSMQRELAKLNSELERRVNERTRELRDAQDQLVRQEKLAVLGQLAGSVGHELRNPLAVISNAVYFLKISQPDASDKVKEYLNIIEKQMHISDKIIADLLDFTRINAVEAEAVSIPQLVQQTLGRFPAPRSVRVTLDLPADLPQAYADPQHVIQILGNLVLNACQSMPEGGRLSVAGRQLSLQEDHWLLITVKDTGAGISAENMKKLFEPLFTTKRKGIGLGLVVSKKLIEANGGKIEVQSEAGAGSTFTIWLPVYSPP